MNRFLISCFLLASCGLTGTAQEGQEWLAIEGGTVFDGTGAVDSGVVILIRGDRIEALGPPDQVRVPSQARRIDAQGKFILPGFVDLHFHYDPTQTPWLPLLFLAQGVTTMRDLGNWIDDNERWLATTRQQGFPTPRLIYAGPHLDGTNPAYPDHSYTLLDELDTRRTVRQLVANGSTSLKVYFRLPLNLARTVIEEADRLDVPVHAHLEIVDARDLIPLGLDGVEHTTSLSRSLLPDKESEAFRQTVLADNRARGPGRYRVWAGVDPEGERATALITLMREHNVNLDATLAIFEPARGEGGREQGWAAFRNMAAFTVRYHREGGSLTIGSHGTVPNAAPGFAFQRELETHVEAGMTPADALQAATLIGAAALRMDDRGTLAPGKLADILILDADPLQDIANVGRVHSVILGGKVVDREALLAARPTMTGLGEAKLSD
jgi:imidazolonepropionase-like amidohydrolase